mmetsp:Transcript_5746/g.8104  ORF Transcript_5746/g.8104 Transcript_5746/m.8104 type:complete len:92 (+) Transcript_5746:1159-1434(+)
MRSLDTISPISLWQKVMRCQSSTPARKRTLPKKNPCASYGDLTEKGVSVAYGDPTSEDVGADIDQAFGRKFTVIIENFSKSAEEISPMFLS